MKEDVRRLEAFEMWIWRQMEKVSWKDKKTNEEVLTTVGEERSLIRVKRNRKKNCIGHILRTSGLMRDVIEGCDQKGNDLEEERERECWMN